MPVEPRSAKELERRLALVLAQSFSKIRFLDWESVSEDGKHATAMLRADHPDSLVAFLDSKGSALLRLDGKPYWSLDGYHKSMPVPLGKHKITAEFTPYQTFGEKTAVDPGRPILAVRDRS